MSGGDADRSRETVEFVAWFDDIESMICGFYRLTPAQVADQTPAELQVMLEGIDWVNDRQWERAAFLKTGSQDLFEYNYPHFRTPRVTKIINSDQLPEWDDG